ncbi:MAG: ABC transporter permease [Verrucomicrobia bacterium]|nr:ABC transporter permease [Verrucomicrobiota bacterium]
MRVILKLAFAYLREHPVRMTLTSLATAASVCMVVWVVSGYDSLLATFDEYSEKALGNYNLTISPVSVDPDNAIPEDVIRDLRADPAVRAADPMWHATLELKAPDGKPEVPAAPPLGSRSGPGGPRRASSEYIMLGLDSAVPPFPMKAGEWSAPSTDGEPSAVLSTGAAKRLGVVVGAEISAGKGDGARSLKVTGIVDSPTVSGIAAGTPTQLPSPSIGEIYVSSKLAAELSGGKAILRFIGVGLKQGADLTSFRFGWAPRLGKYPLPIQFQEAHDIEEALDETASARNMRMQAYAATGIALLVALLVILCSLNMGVSERVRQLAILRAVVLTAGQVRLLVAVEGFLLSTIGLAAGLGGGYAILRSVAGASERLLRHGVVMGSNTIWMALAAAYGGAFLALWIPAWRATRVRPVDAMLARPRESGGRLAKTPVFLTGVALVVVNPLLAFLTPPEFERGVGVVMAVGFIAMSAGFVLVAPAVVAAVDRWMGPAVSRLLMIDPKLLRSQITGNIWRTVGAAVSLMVGLGLYIGVQVWGFTMLEAFVPGQWAPDALISFNPKGIDPAAAAHISTIPGVDPERCLPVVVEQPRMVGDPTGSAERASVTRQDNVVILGIDPGRAFAGPKPLLKLEWVAGNPADAVPMMEKGHACVVPDHFLRETGLKVGDHLDLIPPEKPVPAVRYVIAGAVRLPGWHWLTKHTGFRPRTHRAAALVFADYPSVAADFGFKTASHVWFGYAAPDADPDRIAVGARDIYSKSLGRDVGISSAPDDGPYVRVMTAEWIRNMTRGAARQWIWMIGWMPLVALAIAMLGVLNVILASVRARRWEMGVLRSVGYTRSALVRAVIAEGLLIGGVACVLSSGFGIIGGWCGCGYAQYVSFFGGLHPSLVIPWGSVSGVLAVALLLSAFAAVWPAIAVGRAKPLSLLQQSRSTF